LIESNYAAYVDMFHLYMDQGLHPHYTCSTQKNDHSKYVYK